MRWMKLGPIMQSEVSQKEKHQYSILIHIYVNQNGDNDNPVCKTTKETQMYRTVLQTLCLFCCLTYRVILTIFLNSIYMHQYTVLVFFFWLTSLCIIGSSFIHLIRTDSNVFFLIAGQYSIMYMYHSFLIHSSVDGHLGCFHVLAF